MSFTEFDYEKSIIELFRDELGYQYLYGPNIARDYHHPLFEDELLPCLVRVNKKLPEDAIKEAVYKLKNFEFGSSKESTRIAFIIKQSVVLK
jgi:type I restriction enzyme R subunit